MLLVSLEPSSWSLSQLFFWFLPRIHYQIVPSSIWVKEAVTIYCFSCKLKFCRWTVGISYIQPIFTWDYALCLDHFQPPFCKKKKCKTLEEPLSYVFFSSFIPRHLINDSTFCRWNNDECVPFLVDMKELYGF